MMRRIGLVIGLLAIGLSLSAQQLDSALIKRFAYKVGGLGFAADSLELTIAPVFRGQTNSYQLAVHNFSSNSISLADGKTNRFVRSTAQPAAVAPASEAIIEVVLDLPADYPLGFLKAEVALDTDDPDAPYKFLYLLTEVQESPQKDGSMPGLDTIPRLIFDQYNYDFVHLYRGRKLYFSFYYENKGGMPVVVSAAEVSPNCRLIGPLPGVIEPGEQGQIRVKVFTKGCIGVQHRTVTLYTNDPVTPAIILGVHGVVSLDDSTIKNPGFCREGPGSF